MVTWCVGVLLTLALPSLWMGCGDGTCSNDTQCSGGQICYQGKCSDSSVLDSGNSGEESGTNKEPGAEPGPEPGPEPTKDAAPPQERDPGPEPKPEAAPKVGERTEGQPCDPRREGHARDLCAPGFECAEVSQTAPSTGAPQPSGICLKSCKKGGTDCPSGTACTETLDTKTRQGTGLFVCAKEVDEGATCVGTTTCKAGLTCIRYGTTGTFWICQKECKADGDCASGQACDAAEEGSTTKICKPKVARNDGCSVYNKCDDKDLCVGSGQSIFSSLCQQKCGTGNPCPQGESCQRLNAGGSACFKVAKDGEECLHGYVCESGYVCSTISPGFYSVCRKRCTNATQCGEGMGCARTRGTATTVCQPQLPTGSVQLGAFVCKGNARAISFSSGGLGVCLGTCSGSNDQTGCGALTPETLGGVVWSGSTVWTAGGAGLVAQSADNGAAWTRARPPMQADYTNVTASGDGKVMLISGLKGSVLRSEDSGKTWTTVGEYGSSRPDLWGIALSFDGKLALAVGAKGTVWRSEDGGKTWSPVTQSSKENLYAVAFGQDKAGTGSVAIAVGAKGTVIRSEDGGKTWSAITLPTGVTDGVWGVTVVRDSAVTGLNALAVGEKGLVLESTDAGKTWKKMDTKRTETLRGAAIAGDAAWVVGDKGATLARDKNGTWTYAEASFKFDLQAIAVNGSNAVAVAAKGQVLYSADGGKSWKATASRFGICLGLSGGGGACGFTCDLNKKGADCPPQLSTCRTFNLGSTRVNLCVNGTTFAGPRKLGESCSRSSFSALKDRCGEGMLCLNVGTNDHRCVKSCDINKPECPSGQTCLFSNALGTALCGKEATGDQGCDWGKGIICPSTSICRNNALSGKWVCEKTKIAKQYEHCLTGQVNCEKGLICTGNGQTPYRNFCTKRCDPAQQNSCEPGWQCAGTSGGGGICIEQCNSEEYQCKVKTLRCSRVLQSGRHCL